MLLLLWVARAWDIAVDNVGVAGDDASVATIRVF
jgi:hypothetical protein